MRIFRTREATREELSVIREFLVEAFEGGFSEVNWQQALGGNHFLIEKDGRPAAHASVVARNVAIGDVDFTAGFVEAVATAPALRRRGFGTGVMRAATDHIASEFVVGVLDTFKNEFYERLGWETWHGPTGVRTVDGWQPTPQDDGNLMIFRTQRTPALSSTAPIVTDWS